jgi:sugar O-acyltransferase (sialic acid O-acetyltransferase NeuD family)
MIIVGAKGFAKELLEVAHQLGRTDRLVFFDNVSCDLPDQLYGQFPILRTEEEVKAYFKVNGNAFALGLGNPKLREQLCELFESWGGEMTTLISTKATIGSFNTSIEAGTCIMTGVVLTNDISIGKGVLINLNCTIGHDVTIGDFSELSPGVHVSGNVNMGENCFIGTGAVLLPGIQIGSNVTVGAGAVVTKNVKDGETVKGIPAR